MTPLFWLQIVDRDGLVVRLPGGGALERELVERFTDAIVAKGVGVFRTEAQVKVAIRDGITDAIRGLKHETTQLVN